MTDERIRRRLWIVLLAYETLVIAIVAAAGLNIALAAGSSRPTPIRWPRRDRH
jgi:hypothetical protein